MEKYIGYNTEFKLAICVACRSGIPAGYVLRHFRTYHSDTWNEHKKALQQYIAGMALVATSNLATPEGIHEVVQGVEIKTGWSCGEVGCGICGISEKYIENHCRTAHGKEAAREKAWYQCRMQTLLGHPHIRYQYLISLD
jgi:hypothetical protein